MPNLSTLIEHPKALIAKINELTTFENAREINHICILMTNANRVVTDLGTSSRFTSRATDNTVRRIAVKYRNQAWRPAKISKTSKLSYQQAAYS